MEMFAVETSTNAPSPTKENGTYVDDHGSSTINEGLNTKENSHLTNGNGHLTNGNGHLTNDNQHLANGHKPSTNTDESSTTGDGPKYWFLTSGTDLSRMLQEANYPEEAQRLFLDYYRETICPLLGEKPEKDSKPAAVGWDGSPFEYSFEFKGSTKKASVRFVLDLSELRPANVEYPLSIRNSERVLNTLVKQSPMFDDTWVSKFA